MRNQEIDYDALSISTLLDHYLTSFEKQLVDISNSSKPLNQAIKQRLLLDLTDLRVIIGRTAGNRKTSKLLVKAINKLTNQLFARHEFRRYTLTCIRNVHTAINVAIRGHAFGKETMVGEALLGILKSAKYLKDQHIFNDRIKEMIVGEDED